MEYFRFCIWQYLVRPAHIRTFRVTLGNNGINSIMALISGGISRGNKDRNKDNKGDLGKDG